MEYVNQCRFSTSDLRGLWVCLSTDAWAVISAGVFKWRTIRVISWHVRSYIHFVTRPDIVSKRCEITTRLLRTTNKKSYSIFPLSICTVLVTLKWLTVNDHSSLSLPRNTAIVLLFSHALPCPKLWTLTISFVQRFEFAVENFSYDTIRQAIFTRRAIVHVSQDLAWL